MERNSFMEATSAKDERFEALKQLYPELVRDNKLNLEALKDLFDEESFDESDVGYNLYWPGKRNAKKLARKEAEGTLEPVPGDGVNEDKTNNIYIEGDNLEVLRCLKKSYGGRVKMIYIDPPYNTGKDFIYPDNFTEPVEEYLKFTGQMDEKGNSLVANPKSSGAYHRKWLDMMLPRLQLARELLTNDGVIFISIVDNEQANLNLLCDEVFGEENFVNCVAVKMSEASGVKMAHTEKKLPKLKEYVLIYKKDSISIKPISIPKNTWDNEYKTVISNLSEEEIYWIKSVIANEDRSQEDFEKCNNLLSKADYESLSSIYKKEKINTKEEQNAFNYKNAYRIFQTVSMGSGTTDLINKKRIELLKNKFFAYETSGKKMYVIKGDYDLSMKKPRIQVLFADEYLTTNPCDFWQDIKTTGLDNEGGVDYKNGKKPLKLIQRMLEMNLSSSDLVMDFFSGSATTAEALIRYNSITNGNSKYILVQVPFSINIDTSGEKKQTERMINFLDSIHKPHTICEIGKERIRRAGKKILEEHPELKDKLDVGFKVYRLAQSNIEAYKPTTGSDQQSLLNALDAMEKQVTPLREGFDLNNSNDIQKLLTEILLRQGFALDSQIEKTSSTANNIVYRITDEVRPIVLHVCLDREIKPETVKNIVFAEKDKFVCLNSAINDELYAQLSDKGRVETI